jgi:myo-inositol-1(or 4)-monophosphatase
LPVSDTGAEFAREAQNLADTLREAGAIALKMFRGELRSWTKDYNSPVSEADVAVDLFLRERLSRPDIGWLSEESVDDLARLNSERLFIVDPIDGTRSYIAGREDWSIAAALVEKGRPVAAVVYVPVSDEMYVASSGAGTRKNGVRVQATSGAAMEGARIAGPKDYLERIQKIVPGAVVMPKIHSLALRLARVSDGQIDAAFASVNARDWDLAAADLLVHEAGGALTGVSGDPLVYNLHNPVHGALIAAGRARHQTLIGLAREQQKFFS